MLIRLSVVHILMLAMILLLCTPAISFAGECSEMESESEAIEGIVPKFNSDGTLKSLSMYGEGSFLTPKRSLISTARKQAEMKAKRDFANFLNEKLAAGTLSSYLMETNTVTNANGETSGSAAEINSVVDEVGSNTQAVLSGIVKLDECVDTSGNYVLVRMGWKPQMSQIAAKASQDMTHPSKGQNPSSESVSAIDSGSSIKVVTVVVEGYGADINEAVRGGLRQAISQVFGERLESEIEIDQATHTLEVSGDVSLGVAVETSSQTDRSKSKTQGTIKSYEILSKNDTSSAVVVSMKVNLAKYDSGIDKSKKSLIVLKPKVATSQNVDEFADRVQSAIESKLSSSGSYNMLDREYLSDTMKEINFIASSNASIEDMARLGNHAGADLLVITEVISFAPEISSRKVGDREIKRGILNAEMSLKLLDPATTKVLVSDTISFKKQRVNNPTINDYAAKVAERISARVLRGSGGRSSRFVSDDSQRQKASKEANDKFKALEEKHEEDW